MCFLNTVFEMSQIHTSRFLLFPYHIFKNGFDQVTMYQAIKYG